MILAELIARAKNAAVANNIPQTDYWLVISYFLKLSRTEIFVFSQRVLTEQENITLTDAFRRLENGEPPQYITGEAYFYGLELRVNSFTLIPRPETERLVELTLERLQGNEKILDIGTGSGAIAIALKQNLPKVEVYATDCSSSALEVAKANAEKYDVNIHFFLTDCFPPCSERYDVIISNPPYISKTDLATLDSRIRDKEPKLALSGGEDGLDFYRKLLLQSYAYLTENGFLALEHGDNQKEAITNIAKKEGWTKILSRQDLTGRERYLFISGKKD